MDELYKQCVSVTMDVWSDMTRASVTTPSPPHPSSAAQVAHDPGFQWILNRVALKRTDRMPTAFPLVHCLAAYGGITKRECMYDHDGVIGLTERAYLEFRPGLMEPAILITAIDGVFEATGFKQPLSRQPAASFQLTFRQPWSTQHCWAGQREFRTDDEKLGAQMRHGMRLEFSQEDMQIAEVQPAMMGDHLWWLSPVMRSGTRRRYTRDACLPVSSRPGDRAVSRRAIEHNRGRGHLGAAARRCMSRARPGGTWCVDHMSRRIA